MSSECTEISYICIIHAEQYWYTKLESRVVDDVQMIENIYWYLQTV